MTSVLALILTLAALVLVFAYAGWYLSRVISDDGAHGTRRTPPRSHPADPFDPRSRIA